MIESRIDGEFEGWTGETIFKLLNGQYWQQTSYAYLYHYAYGPAVYIVSNGGAYEMQVDGVRGSITVDLADVVADSTIENEFNGWDGDTIFEFTNGQIWQQAGPGVATRVAVRPRAFVYRKGGTFRMQVHGVDRTVQVQRLR